VEYCGRVKGMLCSSFDDLQINDYKVGKNIERKTLNSLIKGFNYSHEEYQDSNNSNIFSFLNKNRLLLMSSFFTFKNICFNLSKHAYESGDSLESDLLSFNRMKKYGSRLHSDAIAVLYSNSFYNCQNNRDHEPIRNNYKNSKLNKVRRQQWNYLVNSSVSLIEFFEEQLIRQKFNFLDFIYGNYKTAKDRNIIFLLLKLLRMFAFPERSNFIKKLIIKF
jgi:hypothetical protein